MKEDDSAIPPPALNREKHEDIDVASLPSSQTGDNSACECVAPQRVDPWRLPIGRSAWRHSQYGWRRGRFDYGVRGGNERMIGALPGLRYVTSGGHLIEWYGPYAQFGLGGVTGFQWGPAVSLRLGRHDVDDPVVSQIHTIKTTVEAGGYLGYEYDHTGAVPYRLRATITLTTNGGIVYSGMRAALNFSGWIPVHRRVIVGAGAGATWVSAGFNETYFGVSADDAERSGLPQYSPGGGLEQITTWLAAIYQFNKTWYGGAMVYYQRITGAAAESPIVTQRGTRNQVTYGVGIAYALR